VADDQDTTFFVDSSFGIREALNRAEYGLSVGIERDGMIHWRRIPVFEVSRVRRLVRVAAAALTAIALLGIPLFLLRHSNSRAAVPFSIFYGIVAIVSVAVICGRHSDSTTRLALFAASAAPAVLGHLALVFPRERRLIAESPELIGTPYVSLVILLPAGWFALERDPLLWPAFSYLLLALSAGAWAILVLSCGFAICESDSALERARARLLCLGSLLLPLLPTAVLCYQRGTASGVVSTYLWTSAVVMPLPIGLAISRYNLFDLGWHVRRWIGGVAYVSAAAVLIAGTGEILFEVAEAASPAPSFSLLLLLALPMTLALEALRRGLLGILDNLLSLRHRELRRIGSAFETRVAGVNDEDEVIQCLVECVREALKPRNGCAFLASGPDLRPCVPFGPDPPARVALAVAAEASLADRRILHLPLEQPRPPESLLRTHGLELLGSLSSGSEVFGVLLLGQSERGAPYTGLELDFVAMVASQAGIALRNARVTERLVRADRAATRERIALALAHDLGKELDWLARLARRLPERLDQPEKLVRDAGMIQEFTTGVTDGIQALLAETHPGDDEAGGLHPLGEIVDDSIRRVNRLHGTRRVSASIAPDARSARIHPHLRHVITNLLDNALHASASSEPIHIFATREARQLVISVIDSGLGISEERRGKVFVEGYTTRSEQGGLGVGLTVAREIVSSNDGSIDLLAEQGGGTRVVVRLPLTTDSAVGRHT
jgi:signal transduction histidine kinase